MITPFPLSVPQHGGQVRAASMMKALRRAGWHVDNVAIFPSSFFPQSQWGPLDIILDDPTITERAAADVLFADLQVARAAARNPNVVERLRYLLRRLAPDAIQIEHPWDWLVLREALPTGKRPKIIYSSHNIEWSARASSFELGLKRPGADALVQATRALETEFARVADLVLAISDLEATEIMRDSGRDVVYVPPISDLADAEIVPEGSVARAARAEGIRYAAIMGSDYWPNVEGFFDLFPEGLGFLSWHERIWVAGRLGNGISSNPRFNDFLSINNSRFRAVGFIEDSQKLEFFVSSSCVLVPVRIGAGAKMKTADAIASGCPVIATPHAVEGYGPLIDDALGKGVYVADSPSEYRAMVRCALREGMRGCSAEVRSRFSLDRLASTLGKQLELVMAGETTYVTQ